MSIRWQGVSRRLSILSAYSIHFFEPGLIFISSFILPFFLSFSLFLSLGQISVVITKALHESHSDLRESDFPDPGFLHPDFLHLDLPQPDFPEPGLLHPDLRELDFPEPDHLHPDLPQPNHHIISSMYYCRHYCIIIETRRKPGSQFKVLKKPVLQLKFYRKPVLHFKNPQGNKIAVSPAAQSLLMPILQSFCD